MFNYNFLSSPDTKGIEDPRFANHASHEANRDKWAIFCLLALVVFAVFGQAIWFDYIQLDEGILLTSNRFFISNLSNFFQVFKHDINYPSNVAPYYRPMFILSFMLNSQVGQSPLAFHVGNVLLHIIAAYFVFLFFREIGARKEISLISSLLFAVHPAVTPVVAWVPGRIETILTIFTLLSFILFIRFLKTSDWRYLVVFFLSFTIALFTKEVVIGLIPVLLFYYLMYRKDKLTTSDDVTMSQVASPQIINKGVLIWLVGTAGIIIAWFFVRRNILAGIQISDLSFFQMIAVLWSNSLSVLLYLGKTILPFNLTALPVLESSTIIYGLIALACIAVYCVFNTVSC